MQVSSLLKIFYSTSEGVLRMMRFVCLVMFCTIFSIGNCAEKKSVILTDRPKAGMFSTFNDVLSALHCYENGCYTFLKVSFSKDGVYYDPKIGFNWWNYYAEPIRLGDVKKTKVKRFNGLGLPYAIPRKKIRNYPREKAHQLIQKYIHIKPHILEKVDKFTSIELDEAFVIGIHYRGTDKKTEARRVAYEEVLLSLENEIGKLRGTHFKIFVATDEAPFLEFMQSRYSNICFYDQVKRSYDGSSIHLKKENESPYKSGEGAIIDCLLLSKANVLIRTASNLSLWSTYFNPSQRVINLSVPYCDEKLPSKGV